MKLLYITDKFDYSSHNFIDSFVKYYLPLEDIQNDVVYWTKTRQNKFLIPYKKNIEKFIDLSQYDIVIVRNFFWALKQLKKIKFKYKFKLGFHLSFPHSYRRLYQAKIENKAVFRKRFEYRFKSLLEKKLIYNCDFFMPISKEMINIFYKDIPIPYFVTPLGIDERFVIKPILKSENLLKMLYIGTIDKLREFDKILNHLTNFSEKNWILEIYSKTTLKIPNSIKDKVFFKEFIPREKLLKQISMYDIGIFLLPETNLYKVASPTKVMEYYEAGIPAIMSKIPECEELFGNGGGIIQEFDKLDFCKMFNKTKQELYDMAIKGQNVLLKERNYNLMAKTFKLFLEDIL